MRGVNFNRACGWVIFAGVLWFFVRPALADGPPTHGPLTCDPVCVVRYCEGRCGGPHRDRLQGLSDCKRACVKHVTESGCRPCKEPAPEPTAPPGRPRPAP